MTVEKPRPLETLSALGRYWHENPSSFDKFEASQLIVDTFDLSTQIGIVLAFLTLMAVEKGRRGGLERH